MRFAANGSCRARCRPGRRPAAASQGALSFRLQASPAEERWTCGFPDREMRSTLRAERGRLGPTRLCFALDANQGSLRLRLLGRHAFGLPCPRALLPRVTAEEHGDGGRIPFEVSASQPLIGRVAAYRGYLVLPTEESP